MRRARAIFDDAVGRAAAWAESPTRRRKIQGDEIIVPESLVKLKKNPVFLFQHRKKKKNFKKKPVNTGRRRSSGTTPRKCGALPEKLVKLEKTPEKDGETPGKSGEPLIHIVWLP